LLMPACDIYDIYSSDRGETGQYTFETRVHSFANYTI